MKSINQYITEKLKISKSNYTEIGESYSINKIILRSDINEFRDRFKAELDNDSHSDNYVKDIIDEMDKQHWTSQNFTMLALRGNTKETLKYYPTDFKFLMNSTTKWEDVPNTNDQENFALLGALILSQPDNILMNNVQTKNVLNEYFNDSISKIMWKERKNTLSLYIYLKDRLIPKDMYYCDDINGGKEYLFTKTDMFCNIQIIKR
jgi:uncharacterized glyoxalase superfamily protein PhnB